MHTLTRSLLSLELQETNESMQKLLRESQELARMSHGVVRFSRGRKRSRPENPHKPRVRRIITTQLLARAHFRAIDPARPSNTCDTLRRRRYPASSPFLFKILFTIHVRHPSKRERASLTCDSRRRVRRRWCSWPMGYRRKRDFFQASRAPALRVADKCLRWRCARKCIPISNMCHGDNGFYMHTYSRTRGVRALLPPSLSLSLSLSLSCTHTLFLSTFPVRGTTSPRDSFSMTLETIWCPRFTFPHVRQSLRIAGSPRGLDTADATANGLREPRRSVSHVREHNARLRDDDHPPRAFHSRADFHVVDRSRLKG